MNDEGKKEVAAATGSATVSELLELAATWRRVAPKLTDVSAENALISCALDLNRLADSFSGSPNTEPTDAQRSVR